MAISASLVDFQDFKHQMICPDFGVLAVDQYLKDIEFPTPPLSPDHEDKNTSSSALPAPPSLPVPTDSMPLMPQLGMDTMMQQIMESGSDVFFSQSSYSSDSSEVVDVDPSMLAAISDTQALLKDCMWNSVTYEPRHSFNGNVGVYTPAPSPLPQPKEPIEEDDEDSESCSDLSRDPSQLGEDTISPSEVLACGAAILADSKCHPLQHKPLQEDELVEDVDVDDEIAEEEIDVVTISDKPTATRLARKRILSQSAPCSRQASPSARDVESMPQNKKRRCHTKRAHRLNSDGSNMAESDEEQKRASHNILERKRRNDLKSNFQTLRCHIPELEDNQRAPKVTILRKATEFIDEITLRNDDLQRQFDQEKRRETQLLHRLAILKAFVKS